jgi:hypothetical protein
MHTGSRPAPGRGDCPDADTLAVLVADPAAAPLETLAHVERCSACSAELKSLRELPELETMMRQMASKHRRPTRWISLAAAACLVLAVGVAGYMVLEVPPAATQRTAPESADVTPPDGSVLEEPPEAFAWTAAEVLSYRLIIYDEEADRIWHSDPVGSGRIDLPDAVRESLVPGRYYWQLQVVGAGTIRGPYAFELRPTDDD